MKTMIKPVIEHEVLSLITDISYTNVPAWYGATRKNLMMDIIAPKVRTPEKKYPLLLWFCGGAFRVVNKSVWLPEMTYFAEQGFIVASAEYRTSSDGCWEDFLADGRAAVRFLKAHASDYCIDPDRIAVMGESGGGTMASLLGVTGEINGFDQGDFLNVSCKVNAVVDVYGLVNMCSDMTEDYAEPSADVPPWCLEDFLGIGYTEETAKKASAISYVNAQTVPFLILHGTEDQAVPVSQSVEFYELLQKYGVKSDLYLLEGAVHGADDFYQVKVKELIVNWLKDVFGISRTA